MERGAHAEAGLVAGIVTLWVTHTISSVERFFFFKALEGLKGPEVVHLMEGTHTGALCLDHRKDSY